MQLTTSLFPTLSQVVFYRQPKESITTKKESSCVLIGIDPFGLNEISLFISSSHDVLIRTEKNGKKREVASRRF